MKRYLVIGTLGLLVLSACQKNSDRGDLTGSWKLVEVIDKNTNSVQVPPAGSNMDVVISFLDGGKFAGHTLRNTFAEGSYKLNRDEISFGSFSMTKIEEEPWGQNFLAVLQSCSLQSGSPCVSSGIQIRGNSLKITSPVRYDIVLSKL